MLSVRSVTAPDVRRFYEGWAQVGVIYGAEASCNGTSGEIVQGVRIDGRHFLVSNVVDRGVTVTAFVDESTNRLVIHSTGPTEKMRQAIDSYRVRHGLLRTGFRIIHRSDLRPGTGRASSSADMAAAVMAVAWSVGRVVTCAELDEILVAIEPTNPTYYPTPVVFNHRQGVVYETLPPLPAMAVAVLVGKGVVDTVEYNRNLPDWKIADRQASETALALLKEGIATRDLRKIGEAATMSAITNQRPCFNPNPRFPVARKIARDCGAAGVSVSHSGSTIGILTDERTPDLTQLVYHELTKAFPHSEVEIRRSTISGRSGCCTKE